MAGTRRITTVTATSLYDQPATSSPPTVTTSPNNIFVYNPTRQGWEIPAAVRTARNLPNLIVVNAPQQVIGLLDQMISSGATGPGTFLSFLNATAIQQPGPRNPNYNPSDPTSGPQYWPRESDTGGTTFMLDIRMTTSTRGGFENDRGTIRSSTLPGAAVSGFDEIIRDLEDPLPGNDAFVSGIGTFLKRALC